MEKDYYIRKWLEDTLDKEEKEVFELTAEYKSIEKLSESLKSLKAPDYDIPAEYERFLSKRSAKVNAVTFNWLTPALKIAAVLTLIAGSYFFFFHEFPTVVVTAAAEKKELTLPDSSFVALNALSQLSFSKEKWKRERKVTLKGEAFFNVAKGSRFDVETSSGVVTVLGTSFNVKDRQGFFEVTCYEGSVRVQWDEDVVKLLPQKTYAIIDGKRMSETSESKHIPTWRGNESSFKQIPFLYVIREFERQYDVTITPINIDTKKTFTGAFTHTDMSLALKSITLPLNLKYQMEGDKKIILTGAIEK